MVAQRLSGDRAQWALIGGSASECCLGDAGSGLVWSWGAVHGQLGGAGCGLFVVGRLVVVVPAGQLVGVRQFCGIALFGGVALLDFGQRAASVGEVVCGFSPGAHPHRVVGVSGGFGGGDVANVG